MNDAASLLHAVAWPIVILIIFFTLRHQVGTLLSRINDKIQYATRIKIGKTGIELAEIISQRSIIARAIPAGKTNEQMLSDFEQLSKDYGSVNDPDLRTRVATRTDIADRLGELGLQLKLSRVGLSESNLEGKLVALATMIIRKPTSADLACLERAAKIANYRFTRYRLLLALLPTLSNPALTSNILLRMEKVINSVEDRQDRPDQPLQDLIDRTRNAIADMYNTIA